MSQSKGSRLQKLLLLLEGMQEKNAHSIVLGTCARARAVASAASTPHCSPPGLRTALHSQIRCYKGTMRLSARRWLQPRHPQGCSAADSGHSQDPPTAAPISDQKG